MRRSWSVTVAILVALSAGLIASSAFGKVGFTLEREIEIADFGDQGYEGRVEAITYSPNHKLVAVHVGRGLLKPNKAQSELRVYDVETLRHFVNQPSSPLPAPIWSITEATYKSGPVIQDLHWASDSRGFAFLLKNAAGIMQLMYADILSHHVTLLSRPGQIVTGFDVHDRAHYVYSARDPDVPKIIALDDKSESVDLTNWTIDQLLLPDTSLAFADRSLLWYANGQGKGPTLIRNKTTGRAVVLYFQGSRTLTLSPDGETLLTELPVPTIPQSWPARFTPPPSTPGSRLVAGDQDVEKCCSGGRFVNEYVLIDLKSGRVSRPIDAPSASATAGWYTYSNPVWSPTGDAVLLPGVFLPALFPNAKSVPPCVAELSIVRNEAQCIEAFQYVAKNSVPDPTNSVVNRLSYTPDGKRAILEFSLHFEHYGTRSYKKSSGNRWELVAGSSRDASASSELLLQVRQGYDRPPVLVVLDPRTNRSRTVWDPNPKLSDIALGQTSVLHWKDATGRDWTGGLYKPASFVPGKRYPLVIQPNAFSDEFRPSGSFPTGFAARALAANGMVVLETRCNVAAVTTQEGPCQVQGFESGVKLLVDRGIIDPERIGIVGFSRSCYYVLEALTRSRLQFKAASITDGTDEGYWGYLTWANWHQASEESQVNGAEPFGSGLRLWLKNAPTFNMDRVNAAVQIVGEGKASIFSMWEPFALLRYQNKPVDLVLLNTSEHVLTEPRIRMASQGGTVDWMRFWLQGYEAPNVEKRLQYARWEKLCDLQIMRVGKTSTTCVPSQR